MKSTVITEQSPESFVRDNSMCCVFLARLDGIYLWNYTAFDRNTDKSALTDSGLHGIILIKYRAYY